YILAMAAKRKTAPGGGKLWQGRFQGNMADSMERLSVSLPFDRRLFREDIEGSMAHAQGLRAAGVLSGAELEKMLRGLRSVRADLEKGKNLFRAGDEDIHMAVERILSERVGDLGKKMHTGRSRNDQVATDLRLWTSRNVHGLIQLIGAAQSSLVAFAEKELAAGTVVPGYTHMQRGQPVLLAHWAMAYHEMLGRDGARFGDAL